MSCSTSAERLSTHASRSSRVLPAWLAPEQRLESVRSKCCRHAQGIRKSVLSGSGVSSLHAHRRHQDGLAEQAHLFFNDTAQAFDLL